MGLNYGYDNVSVSWDLTVDTALSWDDGNSELREGSFLVVLSCSERDDSSDDDVDGMWVHVSPRYVAPVDQADAVRIAVDAANERHGVGEQADDGSWTGGYSVCTVYVVGKTDGALFLVDESGNDLAIDGQVTDADRKSHETRSRMAQRESNGD